MFSRIGCALLLACLLASSGAYALAVTPTNNGDLLAGNILGPGISLVPGSVSFIGTESSAGTFTGGTDSGLGIDSGIILTTGFAGDAVGPNDADWTDTANGLPGHPALDALVPEGSTYDATGLEFDFYTEGGDVFFNYLFASEEYNEFVDMQYNDVFGFFLDGVNLAVIPGTHIPVAVNNVNGWEYSEYYNNNSLADFATPPYDIEYDGFTDVFTATALNLGAGVHHISLIIGDTSDELYDSAVFIQGGTFSDRPIDDVVPEPATMTLLGLGLGGMVLRRYKKRSA